MMETAQFVLVCATGKLRGAHASRVLVSASRRNELPGTVQSAGAAPKGGRASKSVAARRSNQHAVRVCSPENLRRALRQ